MRIGPNEGDPLGTQAVLISGIELTIKMIKIDNEFIAVGLVLIVLTKDETMICFEILIAQRLLLVVIFDYSKLNTYQSSIGQLR